MAKRKTAKKKPRKVAAKLTDVKHAWDNLRVDATGKKDGIYVNKRVNPTAVNSVIEDIESNTADGKCSKHDLVAYARRHKSHPLHAAFQWDNKRGAEQYRIEQAGLMLRCLVVVYKTDASKKPYKVRAHVSTSPNADGKSYASIFNAIKNTDDMEYLIARVSRLRNSYTDQLRGLAQFEADYPIVNRLIAHEDKGDKLMERAKRTFTITHGTGRAAAKRTTKKKKATSTRKKKTTRKKRA